MTLSDSAALRTGLEKIRPRSDFANPAVADMCYAMLDRVNAMLRNGWAWKGNLEVPEGPFEHNGATIQNPDGSFKVHVDGELFNRASDPNDLNQDIRQRILAGVFLHEAAHTLGFPNHAESAGPYASWPYNYISGGTDAGQPVAQRCIP